MAFGSSSILLDAQLGIGWFWRCKRPCCLSRYGVQRRLGLGISPPLRTGLPQAPRVLFLNMRCKFSQAAYVLRKVLTFGTGLCIRSSSLARSDQWRWHLLPRYSMPGCVREGRSCSWLIEACLLHQAWARRQRHELGIFVVFEAEEKLIYSFK